MTLPIAKLSPQYGTLGQITPDDVAAIAAAGYKTIINNRPDGEAGPSQPSHASIAAAAEQHGLSCVFFPVVSGQLTMEQVQHYAELLPTLPQPVLAFCRTGTRSSVIYQHALPLMR